MSIISVYITHPDEQTAQTIIDLLLKEKLIACGNTFPIRSTYVWQDTIENENEYVSLVKTTLKHWNTLVETVESNHPYDVPCIVKYSIESNPAYEEWVKNSVRE